MHSKNDAGDQKAGAKTSQRTFIEAARRRQIIDAAIEVIAEVGYAKLSFAKIGRRAKISPSLISYHFDDKRDLVSSLVEDINNSLEQTLTATAEGADSHRAAVRAVVEGFIRFADSHRGHLIALSQIASGTRDEATESPVVDSGVAVAEWEEQVLAGQRAGEFLPGDARAKALCVHGALEFIPHEIYTNPDVDVDRLSREVADNIERMLTGRSGPESATDHTDSEPPTDTTRKAERA